MVRNNRIMDVSVPTLWLSLFALYAHSTANPNFVFILVDDLGWANVNFNRDIVDDEIRTPNMDRLATDRGLRLMRHYVHSSCAPTRSSFQSGRLPVHVQTGSRSPDKSNAGIPRNMTGIASKMQLGGYQTHIVGKWVCSFIQLSTLIQHSKVLISR